MSYWLTDHWEITNLTENTFDNNGNLWISANYFWNYSQNYWQYSLKTINNYDLNNNKDTTIIQNDPSDFGEWYNSTRILYFYDNNVGLNTNRKEAELFTYPNPASNKISVPTEIFSDIKTFDILSSNGSTLIHSNFTSNSIDISTLSNGLYFIRLTNNKGLIQTIKFEKE